MAGPRAWRRTAAAALLTALAGAAGGDEIATDRATGLVIADDWELVRDNCIACHSSKLITQQRGTAAQWLSMIRWMQEKQNLWSFDPDTEARLIAYLADNYAPSDRRRRAAIPPSLMPPSPYADASDSGESAGND